MTTRVDDVQLTKFNLLQGGRPITGRYDTAGPRVTKITQANDELSAQVTPRSEWGIRIDSPASRAGSMATVREILRLPTLTIEEVTAQSPKNGMARLQNEVAISRFCFAIPEYLPFTLGPLSLF